MKIELIPLKQQDPDVSVLRQIHAEASIAEYISVSDEYLDYVINSGNAVYYKIKAGARVAGGIHCETSGEAMYLSICISGEYRRRGIARKSLAALLQSVSARVKYIEASVEETNVPSLRLFESCGFERIKQEEELVTYRFPLADRGL